MSVNTLKASVQTSEVSYRSAESGRYVAPGYANSHPDTTVRERD